MNKRNLFAMAMVVGFVMATSSLFYKVSIGQIGAGASTTDTPKTLVSNSSWVINEFIDKFEDGKYSCTAIDSKKLGSFAIIDADDNLVIFYPVGNEFKTALAQEIIKDLDECASQTSVQKFSVNCGLGQSTRSVRYDYIVDDGQKQSRSTYIQADTTDVTYIVFNLDQNRELASSIDFQLVYTINRYGNTYDQKMFSGVTIVDNPKYVFSLAKDCKMRTPDQKSVNGISERSSWPQGLIDPLKQPFQ